MIESAILFMWNHRTYSVCQRGDEKGRNFRFETFLYRATEQGTGQFCTSLEVEAYLYLFKLST